VAYPGAIDLPGRKIRIEKKYENIYLGFTLSLNATLMVGFLVHRDRCTF
jgi:hypothetical protein